MRKLSMFKQVLLFSLLGTATSHAQGLGEECSHLMKFGIYDKFESFTTESHYKQIQSYFKSHEFHSREEAEQSDGKIKADLIDILGIDFGGSNSETNFEEWEKNFESSTYYQAFSYGLQTKSIQKISGKMTDLVGKCLEIGQYGLTAFMTPTHDNSNFTIEAKFRPDSGQHPYTFGTITITPKSVSDTCAPARFLDQRIAIGPEGIAFSCRRMPSDTVIVTLNFENRNPRPITLDAFKAPLASIDSYSVDGNSSIKRNELALLKWTVNDAVNIDLYDLGNDQRPIASGLSLNGTKQVGPKETTSYKLVATSHDGTRIESQPIKITVIQPVYLTSASVHFGTTSNDKDGDTRVGTYVTCNGRNVAFDVQEYGHFDDDRDNGWHNIPVTQGVQVEIEAFQAGQCSVRLEKTPQNGRRHDRWEFNSDIVLTFSNGSTKSAHLDVPESRSVNEAQSFDFGVLR